MEESPNPLALTPWDGAHYTASAEAAYDHHGILNLPSDEARP